MRCWRSIVPLVLAAVVLPLASAWAQYQSPATSQAAGGACTGSNFVLPDANGHVLQCNGSTWQRVSDLVWTQSGTLAYYTAGNVGIGTSTVGTMLTVAGPISLAAPTTVNNSTYTVAATDSSLIFTTTADTVTLPTASSFPGRFLYLKEGTTPVAVTSNASNVVPQTTAAAGTAVLPATAGAYAVLQSDGTNWIIMESGTSGGGGSLTWPLAGATDSVTAPDYAWSGHTNTGLYYNTGIGFTVGGSNIATIASTGVGIGTTSPNASAALDLSANTNSMLFPVGTSGQRPTCNAALKGGSRYNSTTNLPEFCNGSAWIPFNPCPVTAPALGFGSTADTYPCCAVAGDGTNLYFGSNLQSPYVLTAYTFNTATQTWTLSSGTATSAANAVSWMWDGTTTGSTGNHLFVLEGTSGIYAYSYTAPTFTAAGSYATALTKGYMIYGDGNYLYVADGSGGLRAFSYNGTTFTLITSYTTGSINAYAVAGDSHGIYVIDFNSAKLDAFTFNGTTFTLKASVSMPVSQQTVATDGTYIYAETGYSGSNTVYAYTFNGTTLTQVGSVAPLPGMEYAPNTLYASSLNPGIVYAVTSSGQIVVNSFNGTSFTYQGALSLPANYANNLRTVSKRLPVIYRRY